MSIKVKEQHRLGGRVNVGVLDGAGKVIYDRYIDAAKWTADPDAAAAEIADYLAKIPVAVAPTPAVNKAMVTLSDAQIATKLAAIPAANPK